MEKIRIEYTRSPIIAEWALNEWKNIMERIKILTLEPFGLVKWKMPRRVEEKW